MNIETQLRNLLEERAEAIRNKNAEEAIRYYSADIVSFDVAPPLAQRGHDATNPGALRQWFDTWDGAIGLTFDQLQVRASENFAFAFGFMRLLGKRTDASQTDVWLRITVCFERGPRGWLIVHEHQSFPTRMDGSDLSAVDLKP